MRWAVVAAILLMLSLGLKFNSYHAEPREATGAALDQVAAALMAGGYTAQADQTKLQVVAVKRACRIEVRQLDPHATFLTDFRQKLAGAGRVRFAWQGRWHAKLPRLRALFQYYLVREQARQGFATSRDPIWMVAVPLGCPVPPAAAIAAPVALIPAAR